MVKTTQRGEDRRERILHSAAELMAERGYSAVSMADIGALAGIVGSGVYRHFEAKSTILAELLHRVVATMVSGTHEVVGSGLTGLELLDALVLRQTEIVIANRSLTAVYLRDLGNVPPDDVRSLRRQQRQLVDEWIFQCEAVAPSASESELRTVVQAVFALINSICTYDNPLPRERQIASITTMARTAIRSGLGVEVPVDQA